MPRARHLHLDPRQGRSALARRYLDRFGPVTTEDLRWWTGWPVTAARTALADVGAEEVELGDGPGWVLPGDGAEDDPAPWVAALPSLDPATMGWKQRGWYLPEAAADAFDRNGNAGPTLWVDGRVVGAWAQAPDGRMLTHYFEDVAAPRRARRTARCPGGCGGGDPLDGPLPRPGGRRRPRLASAACPTPAEPSGSSRSSGPGWRPSATRAGRGARHCRTGGTSGAGGGPSASAVGCGAAPRPT